MTSLIRAALLLSVAGAAALSAQQPSSPGSTGEDIPGVTFRVEVNYVEVDAFVTDAQGNPATNLTADDFELLEEGTPQSIASFAMVNLPMDRVEKPTFASEPVEPDARTNGTSEGRIYLFLLDDLHVHPARAPRVRAALRQFVEQHLGTNDLGAVVSARGSSADSQDFTSNPRLLLRAIDRFSGKVPFDGPTATVVLGESQQTPADPIRQEEAQRARTLMQSIRSLADFMSGVRGRRKTILLVSEGVGYDIYNSLGLAGGNAAGILEDSEKAVAALTRANVTIYALDPRGMLDVERIADPTRSEAEQVNFRRAQDSLRVLAAETGGFAAVNQNDFSAMFDRIVRENSTYYILGYHPSNERRDGKFRSVDVRVKRPGLMVRSRRGYLAPRGNAPRESPRAGGSATTAVAAALSSPLPVKGIPMRLSAVAFKGSSQKASVELVIEFDPSMLGFTEVNGRLSEDVEVMHSATEPGGKVHSPIRHGIKLLFRPESFETAKTRGVRVLSQMELAPGRYQLRAAVGNKDGATGSVLYDLEIPDFQKGRLEMSGLSVASATQSSVATVRPAPGKSRATLPGPMTATREFDSSDTLVLYGEVYENVSNAPPHTIDIVTELRGEDGRAIASMAQQRASTERRKGGGYEFTSQLELKNLAPGLYVIHVETRSNHGDRPTTAKQVRFRIGPPALDDCKRGGRGCRVADGHAGRPRFSGPS
ncbi:MAG TPA: VWA domain-containing protein [Vicinamibacterales bacterium]|nr:VWA domain-containing protein [Vicinamibacterales bacterium]